MRLLATFKSIPNVSGPTLQRQVDRGRLEGFSSSSHAELRAIFQLYFNF